MTLQEPIGILLVGATGTGKDTQLDIFLDAHPELFFESQSVTTRSARPDDVRPPTKRYPQGRRKYRYVTKAGIRQMYQQKELVEYKPSQGENEYGTPFAAFDDAIPGERIVLTDINYEGAEEMYKVFGGKIRILYLHINPDVIRSRYNQRSKEADTPLDEADLQTRVEKAEIENAWASKTARTLDTECPGIFYQIDASLPTNQVTQQISDVLQEIFAWQHA